MSSDFTNFANCLAVIGGLIALRYFAYSFAAVLLYGAVKFIHDRFFQRVGRRSLDRAGERLCGTRLGWWPWPSIKSVVCSIAASIAPAIATSSTP